MTVELYTTAGCHLCELAYQILLQSNVEIISVEIGDDDDLVARYGTSIPVVKFADNSEINWPFEQHDIQTKLQTLSSK